jgi:hypothetical protein
MKISLASLAVITLVAAYPAASWADEPTDSDEGYSAALPGGSTAVKPPSKEGEAALPGGANEGASTGEGGQDMPYNDDDDEAEDRAPHNKKGIGKGGAEHK